MERPSSVFHAEVQRHPWHVLQPHHSPSRAANHVFTYAGYSRSRVIPTQPRRGKSLNFSAASARLFRRRRFKTETPIIRDAVHPPVAKFQGGLSSFSAVDLGS